QFALTHDLDLVLVDAALGDGLADRRRLRAARHPDVDAVRIGVLGALQEGGEVDVGDRIAGRADDLAAGVLEALGEGGFAVPTRAEIGDQGVGLADTVTVGPFAEFFVDGPYGERGARHVRRLGGD